MSEKVKVISVSVGPLATNCYIVYNEENRKAIIIDPGDEAIKIFDEVKKHKLSVELVLATHGHTDHICAIPRLKKILEDYYDDIHKGTTRFVPCLIHRADIYWVDFAKDIAETLGLRLEKPVEFTGYICEETILNSDAFKINVIFTPGHTEGSVSFLIQEYLFSGDTIFKCSIGRTDLDGGSYDKIIKSIKNKIFVLPDNTIIYPGHGEQTTVGYEKKFNPFLK